MTRSYALMGALTLAIVAGGAAAQPAGDEFARAQTLTVALTNFAFTPKVLHLHRNTPYRLHLVNSSSGGHDFEAYDLFESARVAPADRGKLDEGKIEVSKGRAVDVRFTPLKAGVFKVRCTHTLHATFGMTGQVVVD